MNDNREPYYYEDVIDLREVVQTLLDYKWVILGVTLLAALGTFLVSSFLIAPQYQASAYVTLTEPIIRAELDPSIQVSPVFPETEGLAEMVEADALMDEVVVGLGLENYFEENRMEMAASLQGQRQIKLQVTADDPERAARIANTWADVTVHHLNDLYGTGEGTLETLEDEVSSAREKWEAAQNRLEDYLPQSQVESLEVQLQEQKESLARHLNEVEANQLLISDVEAVLAQMDGKEADSKLSTGAALSIIALQQRVAGGVRGSQFQIQGNDIFGVGYTAAEGRQDLGRLISAVQTQNSELLDEMEDIRVSIGELSSTLEGERFQVEKLTQERDLARSAYTALASQLEETRITQAQEERSARVGVYARAPKKASGPRLIMNSGLAGLVGVFLAFGGVLVFDWWTSSEDEK